jgi:hypothetical protein
MKRRGRKRSRRNPFGLGLTRSNPGKILGLPPMVVYGAAGWALYRKVKGQPIIPGR